MSHKVWASYPPQLETEQLEYLVQTIKDWSIHNSLTVRPNPAFVKDVQNPHHVLATNAPVTLFPSPFPRSCFKQAQGLQKAYNELYAKIANDEAWISEIMKEYVSVNERAMKLKTNSRKIDPGGRLHGQSVEDPSSSQG